MDKRRFMMEAVTIILAAIACALVANALASRERSMALIGDYPNARNVLSQPNEIFTAATTQQSRFDPPVTATAMNAAPGAAAESGAPLAGNAPMTSTAPSASSRPPQPGSTAAPSGKRSVPASSVPTRSVPARSVSANAAPVSAVPAPSKAAAVPVRSAAASAPVSQPADPLARFPPHEKVPYVEVSGDDVAWLHHRGALFLDARRTSVYEKGHIAGARPFSVWESDADDKVKALLAENRDQKQPIVIYCSGGDCEDSHMLAQKLWGVFFNNIYVYKDGFPDWQKRGGPVKSGGRP